MEKIRVYARGMDKKTRQALAWLELHDLEFELLDLNKDDFPIQEYYNVLALTDNGAYDLVQKRSRSYDSVRDNVDVDSMVLSEFYLFLLGQPELINQPIVIRENKLSLGYKEEDISVFLPRKYRGSSMDQLEYQKMRDSDYRSDTYDEDDL